MSAEKKLDAQMLGYNDELGQVKYQLTQSHTLIISIKAHSAGAMF